MENKEKPQEENIIKTIILFLVIFAGMGTLIYGLYLVTTSINLDSNLSFSMDDNTLEAIKILQEVQETQYKYNCDVKLINQSRKYDLEIFNNIMYERGLIK